MNISLTSLPNFIYLPLVDFIIMGIIKERVNKLRSFLLEEKLEAFIVPSTDPHFGEYVQDYYKCREWLSGFDGSAATVVVTLNDAALWTDSRYFVQAETQLEGSGISLMKMKNPSTPSISEWLKSTLKENSSVGIDSLLFSKKQVDSYELSLAPLKLRFCKDPFKQIWNNRPPFLYSEARVVPLEISGDSTEAKLKKCSDALGLNLNNSYSKEYVYILSTCDDIAWFCNIRGSDIPFNPLLYSYLLFGSVGTHLFVSLESLNKGVKKHLESNNIIVHSYNDFYNFIQNLDPGMVRIASLDTISFEVFNLINRSGSIFVSDAIPGGVVALAKAVKNDIEIAGFRRAMLEDALAWVKFWMFLEENLNGNNQELTESLLANKIAEFRSQCADYCGESFSPIVAYEKNGAMPHYSPDVKNPVVIKRESFLLVDTGAHYYYGTTDTTRTFALGNLSVEQKRDYTMVLKGMINLSLAKFPKGTRGASLDILARGPIFSIGKLYMHGTGHGVGHNLCVHEGPQSIRMEENPIAFEPGMVTSNEPAIYESDRYGIRIENILLCKRWKENSFGEFNCFETLTLIPIDKTAIESSLLTVGELEWLNSYHEKVFEKLSPRLSSSEQKWLAEKTSNI